MTPPRTFLVVPQLPDRCGCYLVGLALCFAAAPICAQDCSVRTNVGYRVVTFGGGLKTAVWYPTREAEARYAYTKDRVGMVARNGEPADCGRLPLVVFSHGFGGCGIQSLFFTEELARHGYIVAAPDHRDALCSVEGGGSLRFIKQDESFFNPKKWTPRTYSDRRRDIETVIDGMLESPMFGKYIDSRHIGAAGHSVGGYVVLGIAGGWAEWKDRRIQVLLLFSPYVLPFVINGRLQAVERPVMYQGAQFDIGITPSLRCNNGAYQRSHPPKYYVELRGGNHFEWTNLLCGGEKTVAGCLRSKTNARIIDDYGIAFLNEYLKGENEELLLRKSPNVATYEHDAGSSTNGPHREH